MCSKLTTRCSRLARSRNSSERSRWTAIASETSSRAWYCSARVSQGDTECRSIGALSMPDYCGVLKGLKGNSCHCVGRAGSAALPSCGQRAGARGHHGPAGPTRRDTQADRKSTRLNSSTATTPNPASSLKKKKKKKNTQTNNKNYQDKHGEYIDTTPQQEQ